MSFRCSDACKDLCSSHRYHHRDHCQRKSEVKTTVVQAEMGGFGLAIPPGAAIPSHSSVCRVGDANLASQQPTVLPLGSFGTLRSSAFDSHRQQQQRQHNLIVTSSSSPANNTNLTVDDGTYYTVSDNALTEHLLPAAQRDDNRLPSMTSSSLSATLRSVALTASRRGRSDAVGGGCSGNRLRPRGAGVGRTTEKWPGIVTDTSAATERNPAGGELQTLVGSEHCTAQELSRLQLNLIEKLGYGTFGEVSATLRLRFICDCRLLSFHSTQFNLPLNCDGIPVSIILIIIKEELSYIQPRMRVWIEIP